MAAAVIVCAASASGTPQVRSGAALTEHTAVYYTPKPRFEWLAHAGAAYRVVLWRVPTASGHPRLVVYDHVDYRDRVWTPPAELDFGTRYELFIYAAGTKLVTSWGFTIGFEVPQVIAPASRGKLANLSPELRVTPLAYPYVAYGFEVAETARFDRIVAAGYVAAPDATRTFAGADDQLGTADDVRYIAWPISKVLAPQRTYHWRVRGYYFDRRTFERAPSKESASGSSEATGTFTTGAPTGADALANLTQLTRGTAHALQPTLGKRLELAYTSREPGAGAAIRMAAAQPQRGAPAFDAAREALTLPVKGSHDLWPQWDVDGEGVFFASDRAAGTSNIWFKRRDARGHTQLTFHDRAATAPSVAKDGSRIAYQVQQRDAATIWVMQRDGRSPTELGAGEQPKFSPDGKRIAFAHADRTGVKQLWIMDATGANRVQVTNDACPRRSCVGNQLPTWHPSGQRLVFVSDTKSENHDLWMVELDGSRPVQLTSHLATDTTPEITPDGRYVVFSSQRGGDAFHIWMGELPAN